MNTNSDVTLYNKYFDSASRMDKYKRTTLTNVFWDNKKASNKLRSGLSDADGLLLLIPLKTAQMLSYVPQRAFKGEEGTFTFNIGDRVVRGIVDLEITGKISDLDKVYETYEITSVDLKDFGSPHMQHFMIGGK